MYIRSSAEHAGAIAAIDIGSNSIHMVVARVDKSGHLDVLDADKVGVRLGNYILANGNLSSEGEIKALKIVRHMAEIAKAYKASVRAVATHALREAKNHSEVIERIFKKCGVKIDIIDGVEEARLVFLGMRYALPIEHQLCLGMDIGGGSTEFIIGKGDDIHFATSLKIGAVTLTRSCFGSSPPTSKQLKVLHDQIRLRVDPLVPQISREHFKKAIASSGTAKAIAAVHCRLFKRRLLKDENGYRIPVFELNAIIKALEELKSAKNIRTAFGVDASRAEILLAGAAVMKEASRAFHIKEWIITTFGLREGVVIDTYRRMGNERLGEASDIRGDQVTMLGRDWRIDEIYAGQVARLTLSIFDQLAPILYPKKVDGTVEGKWLGDRDLLRVAAWLHECGKFISTSSYHKHGYYLVNNSRLSGFTQDERHLISLIVLSHRKSGPKIDGPEFEGLAVDEFDRIVFLSAILRLASALNRSRQGLVKAVEIQAHGDVAIRILSKSRRKDSLHVEFLQLERELDEIGKAFRRKFVLDKDEGVVRIVKSKKAIKRVRKRSNISKGTKIKAKKLIRSSLLLAKKVVKNTNKKSVKKASKKK